MLTEINKMRVTPLLGVKTESPSTKTFVFEDALCAGGLPGQFLMLWVPGVDEIPLSIMDIDGNSVSVLVKAVGEATNVLHGFKPSDLIGVRGPFGNHFSESTGRVLMVGGGTGVAPLRFLAKRLVDKTEELSFVMGASTKSELLFWGELEELCIEAGAVAATEDGSFGLKCLATDPLVELLENKFDVVYACGPEKMVRKVFDSVEKQSYAFEASLERLMRCGIGLCGSCMIGKYRVCSDGPVFNSVRLREVVGEFGVSKLDFDGSRINI